MVRIAYLVFAYKNPRLLKRVIERLSSEGSAFFVHIDRKSDIRPFSDINGPNVFLSKKRLPVYWAEFSGIEAILLLIREALKASQRYEYFVLLSGSDYPLRSGTYIEEFFEANRGSEFISISRLPAPGKPISLVSMLRYPSDKPVRRLAFRALVKLGFGQRDYRKGLGGLEAYAGCTWWALSREACEYILQFMEANPHVERYFRNTFAPEESFFHTILGNSPFRPRIRRDLLYEDWRVCRAHQATISEAHVALFETQEKVWVEDMYGSGEALFARKFSDDRLDVLDRIDEMIWRKEGHVTALNRHSANRTHQATR